MPSDRDLSALLDIRDSITLAIAWTAGHDALSLGDDTKTLYAVVRCLEIISEASRRLSPDVRDRHPD